MEIKTILGLMAGLLTTIAFLPQAVKTFKTKETNGLSLITCVTFCTGILFWLIYGILIKDQIIIFFNTVSLALNSAILGLKIRYK